MKSKGSHIFSIFIIVINLALFLSACSSEIPRTNNTEGHDARIPSDQGADTNAPSAGLPPADVDISQIIEELSELPIDGFFEQSFHQLSLRNPEFLVELGIDQSLGLEVGLDNLSKEYQLETMELEAGILELLNSYDPEDLNPDQQASLQVYKWYLEDLVRGHPYADYQYIASHMINNSIHNQTNLFFTDTHPVNTREQAEKYITRLNLVDEKFAQLVDALQIRREKGLIPPQFTIDWALYDLRGQTGSTAVSHPYFLACRDKLDNIDEMSDDDIDEFLAQAVEAIETSVIPAFNSLAEELEKQRGLASDENMGLWQFEDGEDYYAYLLQHYTTTELTADEIHALGLQELERIHAEMRAIFDQLGYPDDEDLETLFQRVAVDSGYRSGSEIVATYEKIIDDTYPLLDQAFEVSPQAKVIVIEDEYGGYYVRGSLDGSRPGAFYAGVSGAGAPYFKMRSLTYHETIPGHHFQVELVREMSLPTFRNRISLSGYAEGWALYAERLAYDLGWYADDPYSNLGRLQYEALRAARLVVDTGLHAKQWSFDQAVEFFMENVGWNRSQCEYQITRYIMLPGQATAYMVGMLQILGMRQQAIDQLGDQFDLAEFHTVILEGGAMPLSILAERVDDYIAEKLAN
jgi:uncharacterized protein (DUF885 family)